MLAIQSYLYSIGLIVVSSSQVFAKLASKLLGENLLVSSPTPAPTLNDLKDKIIIISSKTDLTVPSRSTRFGTLEHTAAMHSPEHVGVVEVFDVPTSSWVPVCAHLHYFC